jgi:hypothetical protein
MEKYGKKSAEVIAVLHFNARMVKLFSPSGNGEIVVSRT